MLFITALFCCGIALAKGCGSSTPSPHDGDDHVWFADLLAWQTTAAAPIAELMMVFLGTAGRSSFLDIGSNLGVYGRLIKSSCWGCGVVSIEAVPRYASFSVATTGSTVFSTALVDDVPANGTVTIFVDRDDIGKNTILGEGRRETTQPLAVPATTIDRMFADGCLPANILVMKISVEGAEWRVLNGARDFVTRYHPVVFVEVMGGVSRRDWVNVTESLSWLFSNGYKEIGGLSHLTATAYLLIVPLRFGGERSRIIRGGYAPD